MLSKVEQEFEDYDEGRLWNEVYKRMKNESSLVSIETPYTVGEARSVTNRPKNRYRDVSPYDHSRVILLKTTSESDYINASLVEVKEVDRKYILTQGPLESTCGDFWLMVWQQESKGIVMLNKVIEKGTPKCAQYWPLGRKNGGDNHMWFDEVNLKVSLLEESINNHYIQRWMKIQDTSTGEEREVLHFQYTTWPDFGVPTSPIDFLNFLNAVRDAGCLEKEFGPAVIHCSAGIGRSGTFCLVDSCLVLIEKSKCLDCIDMRQMLLSMRTYRMGLIQTPDQLRFSYQCVIQGGRIILRQDDTDANSNIRSHETSPLKNQVDAPLAPPRNTSLRGYMTAGDADSLEAELQLLLDHDDEAPPELPPKKGTPTGMEGLFPNHDDFGTKELREKEVEDEKGYEIRHRIREERKRATQEQIKNMKERQRKSETWKRRRSYIKPICMGLAFLVGSYFVYRYLTN